jgi:cobalamin biosynthetic protein CobC
VEENIGPWTVSGPSRWVVKKALIDVEWQRTTTRKIEFASQRLNKLLKQTIGFTTVGTELFTTVYSQRAVEFHQRLCEQNIYTRLCDEKNAIRFGLPANEEQWQKLEDGLKILVQMQDRRQ